MSLRDQLLAKGIASKKQAQRVERELKEARRRAQGNRKRAKAEAREAEAAAKAKEEARLAELRAEREAVARAREEHEAFWRVRQLVDANRVGSRGASRFWFRVPGGTRVAHLQVSEAVARDLRVGRAAICGRPERSGEPEWFVVPPRVAEALIELAPQLVAHFVRDAAHLADPAEALLRADWEPSLRPHRVRDSQLAAGTAGGDA